MFIRPTECGLGQRITNLSIEFLPCGDTALAVQLGKGIDRQLSDRVLSLHERIRAAALPGVVESVPTFRSLLVHYDPLVTSSAALVKAVGDMIEDTGSAPRRARIWRIPVCYAPEFAPDMADVSERSGLSPNQVAECHAATRYHVYMMGFLPGFPYMGDVAPELVLPRRKDPRTRVPAGAIAIATNLTAIYTLESPGGWNLIGATPIRSFDARWTPPALLAPGDGVLFSPITAQEFGEIRAASEAGNYKVVCEDAAP